MMTPHPELARFAAALGAASPRVADAPVDVRRAAVAVVLRPVLDDLELLFIRRAEHPGDPWSGQIAFPGGRMDPSDPDLVATAVRETREETGLDLAAGARHLGALDELHPRTPVLPPIVVRPHVFAVAETAPLVPKADEVAEAFWVSLGVLRDPATAQESRVVVRGATWRVPSFVVDGRVIWGMTERMLRGLLAV
jgi:8-oxo-dGTP pyrophosphatase MutT (NUDIX family)